MAVNRKSKSSGGSRAPLPPPPVLARTTDGHPIDSYVDALASDSLAEPLHPNAGGSLRPKGADDPKSQSKALSPRSGRKPTPIPQGLIPWPVNNSGSLVGGPWPPPPEDAPAPESLGSLDWWATASLGSSSEAIRLLESLISGQGLKAPKPLVQLAKIWREWELRYSSGELQHPPTLNQAAQALALSPATVISFLQSGISALALAQSQVRLALGMPTVVAAAVASATDNENGFQDRKLLFEATGLITKGGGPAVVINNSNTQNVQPLAAAPKVLQNLADAIDANIREAETSAIDGDFQDV